MALALDAEMDAVSPARHALDPGRRFFTGLWSTALEPDELLTGVRVPGVDRTQPASP